jgi:hypothetical protein
MTFSFFLPKLAKFTGELTMKTIRENLDSELAVEADRRKFIAACGRFAVVTAPAMTMLLSTSVKSKAVVASGGGSAGDQSSTPSYAGLLNPP